MISKLFMLKYYYCSNFQCLVFNFKHYKLFSFSINSIISVNIHFSILFSKLIEDYHFTIDSIFQLNSKIAQKQPRHVIWPSEQHHILHDVMSRILYRKVDKPQKSYVFSIYLPICHSENGICSLEMPHKNSMYVRYTFWNWCAKLFLNHPTIINLNCIWLIAR